jgi:hypothetical protein
MKRLHLFPILLISLAAVFSLGSCTNDNTANPTPAVVQDNVQTGDWRITSFIDSGKDETSHFSGYIFTFASNGTITSTNSSVTYSGTWSITDNNSNDDSPGDMDFTILFNLSNDFGDLSEDWQIVSQSSTRIELIHVSGGNGGTDYLTFEKS